MLRTHWPSRALACALLALSSHGVGCRRPPKPEPRPASSAAADPLADGKRLTAERATLPERWKNAESLPDCTAQLTEPADRELCVRTRSAIVEVQQALANKATDATHCALAASAALQSQRASEALRQAGLARLFDERKAALAAGSAAPSGAPPQRRPHDHEHEHASPLASARHGREARVHDNPDVQAIQAYARVSTLGLRHLGMCLQYGALALRGAAASELERLGREQGNWAGLRALVLEAKLVEPDPAQKRRLQALLDSLKSG